MEHIRLAVVVSQSIRGTRWLATTVPPEKTIGAAAFLKHKLKDCEVTYVELAQRLRKHGFKTETEALITNKLARGTFPATFFLACLAALEFDGVVLEEI